MFYHRVGQTFFFSFFPLASLFKLHSCHLCSVFPTITERATVGEGSLILGGFGAVDGVNQARLLLRAGLPKGVSGGKEIKEDKTLRLKKFLKKKGFWRRCMTKNVVCGLIATMLNPI